MMKQYRIYFVLVLSSLSSIILPGGCSKAEDPIELYNLGVDAYNNRNYPQAMSMFKWSHEKNREFSLPMIGMAKCHLALAKQELADHSRTAALQDLEESLHWTNQATNADPGNMEGFRTKIAVLHALGQAESEVETAQWAAKNAGPSAKTILMLAETYIQLGDLENAEKALTHGLGLWPGNADINAELGELYENTDRSALALKYYEQAYRLDPSARRDLVTKIAQLKATSPD
jgi:tetratricopeptide (TPR) repeat protein